MEHSEVNYNIVNINHRTRQLTSRLSRWVFNKIGIKFAGVAVGVPRETFLDRPVMYRPIAWAATAVWPVGCGSRRSRAAVSPVKTPSREFALLQNVPSYPLQSVVIAPVSEPDPDGLMRPERTKQKLVNVPAVHDGEPTLHAIVNHASSVFSRSRPADLGKAWAAN